MSAAYVDELRSLSGHEQSERHSLLSALLGGEPAEDAARRAGVRLPAAYTVLALHVGAHPDEDAAGVDPVVAGRRKVRRMRAELLRHGRALSLLDTGGGTVLLPADDDPAALVAALGRAAGAPVVAAAGEAAPPTSRPWPSRRGRCWPSCGAPAARRACTGCATSCWTTSSPGTPRRRANSPRCWPRWTTS
ncbi:hypothetical protein ACFQV2_40070 [Actinokineospora soli]|uniref:PucR C-terminal helix-turn-helix domain-containing protein n=1 Tax=Actinokineospora soli TaxID=1048753 RepID=A0ABW2TYP7_9PSEU